jgi:hypothetical protein
MLLTYTYGTEMLVQIMFCRSCEGHTTSEIMYGILHVFFKASGLFLSSRFLSKYEWCRCDGKT